MRASDIKAEAQRLGFNHCGMAPAEPVSADYAAMYRRWLDEGHQAEMHYLENYFEKRMDPRLLVEGVRTIISVALNYRPQRAAEGLAWYAQGKDYHDLMRERLTQLMEAIGAHGRCFVDTAPVPERYWAWRCGLGWTGKHGQLVIPNEGSTFFLGELFIVEEVDAYDEPMPNRCGKCTRCIDACPTGAIVQIENGKLKMENGKLKMENSMPTINSQFSTFNSQLSIFNDQSSIFNFQLSTFNDQSSIFNFQLSTFNDQSSTFNFQFSTFNSKKCLSYLTIENRGELPQGTGSLLGETFYGCDRCLKACPHLKVKPTDEASLQPSDELLSMTPDDWQHLTPEQYQALFKGSAVKRAKFEGLTRNIQAIKS